MSRLSFYVLRQLLGPIVLFAFLMTCVIWLTESLRLLDLIINRGQSAPTFLYLSILVVPSLLVIILPVAFFLGTLYALSRLNSDSELVVMSSAGFSRFQLGVPVFIAAFIVMGVTYLCGLYLMPAGQRAMSDKVYDIRADIGTALLTEGAFNTPAKGLTVFIRQIDPDGEMHGILVQDSRDAKAPSTFFAVSGEIVQSPAGTRLIMRDGTLEQSTKGGARLLMLNFKRYPFNLDQFSGPARVTERAASERFLPELFHPDSFLSRRQKNAYLAEAHNRLSQPLYCLAFALIALAAVTRGRRARGANALRMTMACVAAVVLRVAGYAVPGLTENDPTLCVLFYIIPLVGAGLALLVLFKGFGPPRAVATAEAAT